HTVEALGVSFEALLLGILLALSWRRLLSIPTRLRSDPYVTMAVVYVALFIFALGTVSNFGILSRERSQLVPFVFVLLCIPPVGAAGNRRGAADAAEPAFPAYRTVPGGTSRVGGAGPAPR